MARNKKDPSSIQARNFKFLLYPDNIVHVNALNYIMKTYPNYIGITHDMNPDNKAHTHLVLALNAPKMLKTIAKECGFVDDLGLPDCQFVRPVDGRLDRFLVYLTHLDQPDKEQYPASKLFGSSSMLSAYGRAATKFMRNEFDMSDCVLACLDWISSQAFIIKTAYFARWLCSTPYFKAGTSPLVRAAIDEHNQAIYRKARDTYIDMVADGQQQLNLRVQYPEAAPPDKLPVLDPDELEGFDV